MGNRTKILLSAYACEPNRGSEPGVGWNWAINLTNKYDVYVITRANNKQVIDKFIEEHKVEHIHFFYYDCSSLSRKMKKLPYGVFLYYKRWQRKILPIARDIVSKYNIDIVHHITFNEYRTPGKLYKIDRPFVWGPIGGGQLYNPVTKGAFFRKMDIYKEMLRNWINKLYLLFSVDIKMVIDKAEIILIADQSTERLMPHKRKYYRLLETAYNPERNQIKKYDNNIEKIKLLWVGGIIPRKGLKVLIDALGETEFRKFELVVVGDGCDKELCEKLAESYGLSERIIFKGALSYENVNLLYDSADVFIFSSLRDTSGNVVLEAMSHGLPVIAFKHHGVGEIVTEATGDLIDVKSYNQMKRDLVEKIRWYYDNNNMIRVKGMYGRQRLEQLYTWDANVRYMGELYDQLIERIK